MRTQEEIIAEHMRWWAENAERERRIARLAVKMDRAEIGQRDLDQREPRRDVVELGDWRA